MHRQIRVLSASCGAALALLAAACEGPPTPPPHQSPGSVQSSGLAVPTPSSEGSQVTSATGVAGFFGGGLVAERHGSFGLDRIQVMASNDPRFAWILRVTYPAGSASQLSGTTYGSPSGGAQLYLLLRTGSSDMLHLRYYVRFPAGFDFVKGGKLPGLFGGTITSGRRIPNGADGFSTRYMWRRNGAAEVYAYLPTSVAHGTSLGQGSWVWRPGLWTCVEQEVRLNTPGASDGTITVWVNGARVYQATGLDFRMTSDLKIDGVFFSTFFGGGDPSWATPRDQYADFAGFAVSRHAIGPLPGP